MKLKKYVLGKLLCIHYIKLKDAPEVWSGNNLGNISNELNRGWMTSHTTGGWRELNQIRKETGIRYKQIEFVQLKPFKEQGLYKIQGDNFRVIMKNLEAVSVILN